MPDLKRDGVASEESMIWPDDSYNFNLRDGGHQRFRLPLNDFRVGLSAARCFKMGRNWRLASIFAVLKYRKRW